MPRCYSDKKGLKQYPFAVSIREMYKDEIFSEFKKSDLFVLGGEGILFDGLLDSFLRDVNWAKELGIPVMIYAVSVGPVNAAESKQRLVETLNVVDLLKALKPK